MIKPSEDSKRKFLHILNDLNNKHVNIFTQSELSMMLGISRKTLSEFKQGRILNFWMLQDYAAIIGITIEFNLEY